MNPIDTARLNIAASAIKTPVVPPVVPRKANGADKVPESSIRTAMELHGDELKEGERLLESVKVAVDAANGFLNPLFQQIAKSVEVEQPELPEAELDYEAMPEPLFTSMDTFEDATTKLLEDKL